ncbi:MAG: hypothetical protein GXO69_09660 [Acidobacteria bacterium]|nr:hypothetical protein [Acidobacteriota bacterium]
MRIDRLAFVVGKRPVTLSEVRAWVYLQSGTCLPSPLTNKNKQQIQRIIASEKLYQAATKFGRFSFHPRIVRQAMRVMDLNRGFRFLDKDCLHACHVSLSLLEEVVRRELVVQHYIRSRSSSVKPGEDTLLVLAAGLEPDIPVENLLFPMSDEKNIAGSGIIQPEKH